MGKILVVEPRRMLQQAMALVLVPEHELRFSPGLPRIDDPSVAEYDLFVIDAAGLREENKLDAQEIGALQGLGVPTVWIEEADKEVSRKPDHFAMIQRPIEKKAILEAVARCLEGKKDSRDGETVPQHNDENAPSREPEREEPALRAKVIDLTDVVEEEPIEKSKQQDPRK